MYEILVVDDVRDTAEQFAQLIELRTGLRSIGCHTPELALSAVRENSIKVAVLDQRMPLATGVELFSSIRGIDSSIRAIMVTGEARPGEVGNAFTSGSRDKFSGFVLKEEVDKLPEEVMRQYFQYQVDRAADSTPGNVHAFYSSRRRFLLFGDRIEYRIVAFQVLDEEYVAPESWTTVLHITAGQENKYTNSASVKDTFIVERTQSYSLKGNLGSTFGKKRKVDAKLEAAANLAAKNSRTTEVSHQQTSEMTIRLPDEPTDPTEIYVRARHLQIAPIYRRVRLNISKSCGRCDEDTIVPLTVLIYDSRHATRQIDYRSNGDEHILDTGVLRLP
ncbi:response regulator [Streptomyces sp. ID05-39B]|uniref:response regulator n=1 Tax=Streptomyces sp. ID05-39B TaxID=3028664 RepID=UPI0029A436C1|nr:response regulator [Streptomyces sp. ID05-39B]MDX3528059.1 response regulator [Streptomyces sp. ID05-39B]